VLPLELEPPPVEPLPDMPVPLLLEDEPPLVPLPIPPLVPPVPPVPPEVLPAPLVVVSVVPVPLVPAAPLVPVPLEPMPLVPPAPGVELELLDPLEVVGGVLLELLLASSFLPHAATASAAATPTANHKCLLIVGSSSVGR
jgi:hypothetical protein